MVIAERNKKYFIPSLILGLFGVIVAIFAGKSIAVATLVIFWILNSFLLLFSLYGFLIPSKAIVRTGDSLVLNFLFKKKVISIDKIENVSVTERGEWYLRKRSISSDISFFSDMRRLTINYKENDILRHSSVLIKNASAAKCAIDSMIKISN